MIGVVAQGLGARMLHGAAELCRAGEGLIRKVREHDMARMVMKKMMVMMVVMVMMQNRLKSSGMCAVRVYMCVCVEEGGRSCDYDPAGKRGSECAYRWILRKVASK